MTYGDRKYNHETRSLRRTDIVHGISLQSLNPLILRDFLDLGVFWRILRGFLGLCRLARARGASLRLCRHDDREERNKFISWPNGDTATPCRRFRLCQWGLARIIIISQFLYRLSMSVAVGGT